ncbi:MAG: NAD(P)H-binding protein [Acidobacteria bacterium]|nr:NAD(P)H-binding protein [Acidobacteriota bacterium]
MRIFLTGATGYVGAPVMHAFLRGGHEVVALVRSADKADRIARHGVQPIVGELARPDLFKDAAAGCDCLVHTAFESSRQGAEVDLQAVHTFLEIGARRASLAPTSFIYTSGVWVLGDTPAPADEGARLSPTPLVAWRPAVESRVVAGLGALRTVVVRPGIVYGSARGIVGDLLRDAGNGLVRVVGSGQNHWPCVYERDLADLYVRLAVHADAAGIFHATDEADERVDDIVEALARHMKSQPDVRHMPIEEARAKMGPYADALALDQRVRSPRARALGWAPTLSSISRNVPRLLEEFRSGREAA